MAYQAGDIVRASDYNNFVNSVDAVYGVGNGNSGYGQTGISLTTVSVGDTIQGDEWIRMRNAIQAAANHQGTGTTLLPPTGAFDVGDIITAHEQDAPSSDPDDFQNMIANITSNRLNTNGGASLSLVTGVQTHSRGSTWSGTINTTQRADWGNENDARYFFNSGGKIRMSFDHPNGTSPQDDDWRQIFADIGNIEMDHTQTTVSGTAGSGSTLGFYDLTGTFQQIYTGTNIGSGAYSDNDVFVEARTINIAGVNGGNGTGVEFRITFADQHSNAFSDSVAAGTNVDFDITIADVVLSGIQSPTWTTQESF